MERTSSALSDATGILAAFLLQRAAELLVDPATGTAEERKMVAGFLREIGEMGVAQESLKLATKPK